MSMIKGGKNMQKKKNIAFLLLIVAVCFLVTGCGKKAELEKNSTIVKYDGGKINELSAAWLRRKQDLEN